jgi:uncharacterized protein
MFHLILTLVYTIPNIYVFFRIKHLFINKQYQVWYILVYLIMAAIYPITQTYAHQHMNILMQVMSTVSGYLLPFFLYLFLSLLVFDLFLLLNLLIGAVPLDTRKSFSFRFYSLSIMIILSVAIVIAGAVNHNTIRVSKYRIEVPGKRTKADHLLIAFVADIHIQQNTRLRFIEHFVSKVNALNPDLMLYGGDLLEGDSDKETTSAIESELRKVRTKYGTFGVSGNHEFYGGNGQNDFFRESGIILLGDTIIRIDSSFFLAGRYDQHVEQRKSANELLGIISPDLPVILLDHRPTELQEVSRTGTDVQFSGHTHNGQLFPINLITRRIYELSWGHKKIKDTHFFVTSGLRLWGPPVKTAGKSEIMLVDVFFVP